MEDEVIYRRYRELACSIIAQGVNDWLRSKGKTEYSLYHWIENCPWFDYLNLDREYFYVKVLNLKEKGVKSIKFYNYGQKDNL